MYLIGWGVGRGGGAAVTVGVPRGDVKGGPGVDVLVAPSCASAAGSGAPPDAVQTNSRARPASAASANAPPPPLAPFDQLWVHSTSSFAGHDHGPPCFSAGHANNTTCRDCNGCCVGCQMNFSPDSSGFRGRSRSIANAVARSRTSRRYHQRPEGSRWDACPTSSPRALRFLCALCVAQDAQFRSLPLPVL